MPRWTEAQVTKLAPDDSSVTAARRLTNPALWSDTGSTDILLWGKCQGSGKSPYQVSVDLAGPAFRCSCPSRKLPCKHALALLLLWVRGGGAVEDAKQAAPFAQEWADARAEKGAARQARTESTSPPDPVAQAKRLEERLALMTAGLDDFSVWLRDLVRAGTAAARQQPYGWWDETAARLVDAQLPGLAGQVRAMAGDVHRREDWADHLLAVCGRWWTATRAWTIRDALDGDGLADLRAYLGWARPTAEVKAADTYASSFQVLGGHRSDDGRLQQQRTWLRDEATGELLVVLDFSVGMTPMATPQLAGTVIAATVGRYPGTAPRRVLFAEDPVATGTVTALDETSSVTGALAGRAERLAAGPWLDRVPVTLAGVTVITGDPPSVRDAAGDRLDLVDDGVPPWPLLALTGGHPADVFGELDGGRFRPLSVAVDGRLVAL
jgi:SWIM zinc finger